MTTPKTAKKKPAEQLKAFRKAARELGADKSDERFKDALRKIAKVKPQAEKPKGHLQIQKGSAPKR